MKPANSGWAAVGFDLNSGWNCTATNQGWSGNSTISTSEPSGLVAGDEHAVRLELLAVDVVELVAMAMPLGNRIAAVAGRRAAGRIEHGLLSAEPHRAPFVGDRASARPAGKSPDAACLC